MIQWYSYDIVQNNLKIKGTLTMLAKDIEQTRYNMVEQQIRPCEVSDPSVLEIIQQIPRENFVPKKCEGLAFADIEIPLAHDENMMFPRIEARLLQALAIQKTDTVLEIGTGSGFVTACLAKLSKSVISLDIHSDFTEAARNKLTALNIENVTLETANVFTDEILLGSYDVIATTGSVPVDDGKLKQMLNDGGRLFLITGSEPNMTARLITRTGNDFYHDKCQFETVLKALEGAPQASDFQF